MGQSATPLVKIDQASHYRVNAVFEIRLFMQNRSSAVAFYEPVLVCGQNTMPLHIGEQLGPAYQPRLGTQIHQQPVVLTRSS